MRKFFVLLMLSCFSVLINAEENKSEQETAKPTFGVKLDRPVSAAKIEDVFYDNVIVELDAADKDAVFNRGVKITVKDIVTKKKIYKKRFYDSFLYGYSKGTIYVGKGNILTQLALEKYEGKWVLSIREGGLYH